MELCMSWTILSHRRERKRNIKTADYHNLRVFGMVSQQSIEEPFQKITNSKIDRHLI